MFRFSSKRCLFRVQRQALNEWLELWLAVVSSAMGLGTKHWMFGEFLAKEWQQDSGDLSQKRNHT